MFRRSGWSSRSDAAYNNVHLYLADSGSEGRRSWLRAVETIEQLHPRAVIAGHKDPSASDGPEIIAETRGYIRDFEAGMADTSTALELYSYMRERHAAADQPQAPCGDRRAPAENCSRATLRGAHHRGTFLDERSRATGQEISKRGEAAGPSPQDCLHGEDGPACFVSCRK